MSRLIAIATLSFSIVLVGCSILDSRKDDTASILNPRKIHVAYDVHSKAYLAGQIPIADYYASLDLARSKYDGKDGTGVTDVSQADQRFITNYISEGIGLVDAYCRRWFQGLDDTSRLLAYQNKNVNVITQLGTAFLGIGGATSAFVAGYGAGTTAYAGLAENFNSAFLVAPTASKVKEHIESVMASESSRLRADSGTLSFKEAYSRVERYADLCTHARAKEIVDQALDLTKTQIGATSKQVETVKKP